MLLVTNKQDCSLSIIDPEIGREVSVVSGLGVTGHEVIASPDGTLAYVTIYGDSGVGRSSIARAVARPSAGQSCDGYHAGYGHGISCLRVLRHLHVDLIEPNEVRCEAGEESAVLPSLCSDEVSQTKRQMRTNIEGMFRLVMEVFWFVEASRVTCKSGISKRTS